MVTDDADLDDVVETDGRINDNHRTNRNLFRLTISNLQTQEAAVNPPVGIPAAPLPAAAMVSAV